MGSIIVRSLTDTERQVAGLAAYNVPLEIIAKRTACSVSEVKAMIESEHIQAEISLLRARNAASGDERLRALNDLAIDKLFEILSIDYDLANTGDKKEIARTARFVVESNLKSPNNEIYQSNQINNVVVAESSIEAIARYLASAQRSVPQDIIEQYQLESVAYTLSCSPGTEKGVINYDPDLDTYQCHVCGEWFHNLYDHVTAHNVSPEQYKKIFEIYD